MKISYNTKIVFNSPIDQAQLIRALVLQRDCVNFCNKIQFTMPTYSLKDLHSKTYYYLRAKFPDLKSNYIINAERECLDGYRAIKKCGHRHKLKTPPIKQKLSSQYDHNLLTFKGDILRLSTISTRINVRYIKHNKLINAIHRYKRCDPSLFVRNNEVFIRFVFDAPEPPIQPISAVGVDLGIRRFAATSEGNIFIDKLHNGRRRRLRHLKRSLQSKGTKSAKRHLKKIRRKEQNQGKNFDHHLSKKILQSTKANIVVLEDLTELKKRVKAKKGKHVKLKRLATASFYRIRQFLTYKAPLFGKRVETVCPSFTSQINHRTGRRDGERKGCRFVATRKSRQFISTSTGRRRRNVVFDADVNAAINIANRFRPKLPISSSSGLDGQAVVNQPIVGTRPDKSILIW